MSYLVILRLVHILCAVFWAGTLMYLAGFIVPTVKKLGPDGGKFMQQLARTNRLPLVMNLAASLTILAGILLMERVSGGFQSEWFSTQYGMIISLGAGFSIIAYIIGIMVNMPAAIRMGAIGKQVAASGAPPTPEQQQTLQRLRKNLFTATNYIALLLVLATACMAVAQYWS